MRRFAVAVVVFAVAITAPAQFRIENADGTETTIPSHSEASHGFIVEFVAPPAAIAANGAGKTAIADYQATFARFRNDLGTILNAKRSGKTAVDVLIRRQYFVVFNGVALDVAPEVATQIRALPYVKRVVADGVVHALADSLLPNITLIRADKVWTTLGTRGQGVKVAIIDTGIDYNHPALGQGFGPGFKVIGGWDFVNDDADPFDDAGHGTHVAGIVAGQSDQITGVAPEVSLIAYKVLNASGNGSDSDVLAGVERAADPNEDGNTSDHVDVVNLSLGGSGNPDDPLCVAIDNATAAGVTFAVAAGNSGVFHGIASPGTARSAITVGASDLVDHMASFSSRGPNMKNMSIKPDVIAPGFSVLSSYPGNKYASLSGTSMASPHVAGAAALLKSLHHDWTPAQIKLALMNNVTFLQDDIMATGAGRIDVLAAATGNITIDPPSLSLGLAPLEVNNWNASRALHFTNRGAQAVTYNVKSNIAPGESVSLSASSITIPAGGSADLSLIFGVDNGLTKAGTTSFTGGGQVVLTNAASPLDIRNIQFAFTKAARATVTFDRSYPDALWINDTHTTLIGSAFLDEHTSEALMLPASWDMLIYTVETDPKTGGPTDIDFIAREAFSVTKDTLLALTAADVPHTITLGGRKETGQTLAGDGYASSGRILIGGPPNGVTALTIPWSPVHTMHFSDVSEKKSFLFYETLLDARARDYYVIQHPPVTGVSDDVSLTTGSSALRGGTVQFSVPAASRGDRRLSAVVTTTGGSSGLPAAIGTVDAPTTNARVFVSPDVSPSYSYGLMFSAITDGAIQFTTPVMRVVNDKLVSFSSAGVLPWTYSGSTYQFGFGPRFPTSFYIPAGSISTTRLRATVTIDIGGPLGEIRLPDRFNTNTVLYGSTGNQILSGGYSTAIDGAAKGPYRVESVNQGELYPGVPKTTTVSMAIDNSHSDYFPPTLTTMTLLDGNGLMVSRLEPHGSGSLLFSAADFGLTPTGVRIYQSIRGDATHVSCRYHGETAWRPLTATQGAEDTASSGGILYRVDLAGVTNVDHGYVDLKFELADAVGNTTIVTMAPAFSVGPEVLPRHRASR
jgi:subtilisin family serine protease